MGTDIDPKPASGKGRFAQVVDSSETALSDNPPVNVVGRDLQAVREVLSLHPVDPRGAAGKGATPTASGANKVTLISQAAVRVAGDRVLQLYICTPLEKDANEAEALAIVPAGTRRVYRLFDIRRIWQYLVHQQEVRRQREGLMSMNDHMLRDIGIESRSTITSVFRDYR